MFLLPLFVEEPAKAPFSYQRSARRSNTTDKEELLTSYWQLVNYLPETYATDDIIREAEADILNYK